MRQILPESSSWWRCSADALLSSTLLCSPLILCSALTCLNNQTLSLSLISSHLYGTQDSSARLGGDQEGGRGLRCQAGIHRRESRSKVLGPWVRIPLGDRRGESAPIAIQRYSPGERCYCYCCYCYCCCYWHCCCYCCWIIQSVILCSALSLSL